MARPEGLRVNIHLPQHIPEADDTLFDIPPEQPSQFRRGLRAGTAGLLAGTARAGEAAGFDTADFAAEQERQAAYEASKARTATVEDIDNVGDFLDWSAFKLGEIAPTIMASVAGGASGGLVGRAVAGGTKLANRATKVGAVTGMYGASATPQAGQIFQEIREESGIEAPGAAFAGGALAGALDVAPQLRLFGRILRPGTREPFGREALTQAGTEAVTEAAQEGIALGTRALVDPEFDPLAEPNLDQTISRLLNAGAAGALGGSLGGAVADISALRSRPRDRSTGRPGAPPTPQGAALSTTFEDALDENLVQQMRDMAADTTDQAETQDIQDRIDALQEASEPGSPDGLFEMLNSTEFFKGAALSPDAREVAGLDPIPLERDSLRQKLTQMNEQWFRDNPDQFDLDVAPYRIVTSLDAAEDEAMRAFPYDANLRRRYIEDFAQGILDDKEGVTVQRKYAQARQDYARARERGESQETLAGLAEQGAVLADRLGRIQPVDYRELGMREGRFDARQFLRNFETIAGATTQRPDVDLTFDRLPKQRVKGSTDPANWVSWKAQKGQKLKKGEFAWQDGRSKRIVNLPNAIAQVRAQGFKSATRAGGREPGRMERLADEMTTAITLLNEQGWMPGVTSRQELVDLVGPETVVAFTGPRRTGPVTLQQVLDQGLATQRDQFPERTLFDPGEIETFQGEGLESMPEAIAPATPPETDVTGVFTGTEPARPRFEEYGRRGQAGRRVPDLDVTVAADELERQLGRDMSMRELQELGDQYLGGITQAYGPLGQTATPPLVEGRTPEEVVKTLKASIKRLRKSRPDAEVMARNPDAARTWAEILDDQENRLVQAEREVKIAKQIRRRLKAEVKRLRDPRRESRTAGQKPLPTPRIIEPPRQSQVVDPELQRLLEEDQALAQGADWTEDGERRIEAAQRAVQGSRLDKEEAIRFNRNATPISQELRTKGFRRLGDRGAEDFAEMRDTLGLADEDVQFITPQGTDFFIDFVSEQLGRPDFQRSILRGNTSGLTIQGINETTGEITTYVWVRPDLAADLHTRVLAHEMGHALYMTRAANIPTNVARAIMDEYQAWRATYDRPGITALELLRSKKGDAGALLALINSDRVSYADMELREMSEAMQEYNLSFDEWWADRVSEWMHRPAAEAKSAVQKFFAAIADAIRKLFDQYSPGRTVDDYLASLGGGQQKWTTPASALDLAKVAQPDFRLPSDVRSGIARLSRGVFDDDPDDVANMAWLDANGTLTGSFYSSWLGDVWDALTPEMRSILGRTALSAPIQSQLRRLLAGSEEALAQIREPKIASAYAYAFWRAGQLNVQGDMQRGFTSIKDAFFNIVRYIANEDGEMGNPVDVEESARVFDALREHRMRVDPTDGRFEPLARVQDGPFPIPERWAAGFERLARVGSSLFSTLDTRLRETDNPALIQLSNMFARGTGRITTEPGYWQARNTKIGEFTNIAKDVFDGMELEESSEFLDYVYGARNFDDAPAEWQERITELRGLMRSMLNYQRDAGIEIRDLGENYFPWVMDLEQMENNREGFYAVINQDKYRSDRVSIAATANGRLLGAQANAADISTPNIDTWAQEIAEGREVDLPDWADPSNLISEAEVADYIYDGALSSQGYLDAEWLTSENEAPYMRFMNTRILNFVDPAEIRPFLSDYADQTVLSYVYQAVKHAEYTRRFAEDNSKLEQLLDEAREFGATEEDLKLATDAVHANMGTYGVERALWLHKHLGLALPRPRAPINDTLNRAMGAMLVFQNLKYLGLATITSLVDPLGISVRGSSINMAVKSMFRSVVETIRSEPTELTDLAEMLGLIEHTTMNEALSWRYEGQYMQGMSKKINDTWFKLIGLDQWTRMVRLAATSAAQSFIKKHTQDPNQHSERYLMELNLQPGDALFREDGTLIVLTEQERQAAAPEELARDNRVRQAVSQFVDESILRPNPMQRTLWGSDPHFMLFQHLKSFMYSFYTTILKRVGVELGNHNFYPVMALGMYIPAMIAATAIRDLIRYGEDGNPYKADWTLWDYMEDGAARAGLYGYMGTLGADIQQDVDYGGYGIGGMFSTLTDTITDIDDVLMLEGDALIEQLPGSVIYSNWLQ